MIIVLAHAKDALADFPDAGQEALQQYLRQQKTTDQQDEVVQQAKALIVAPINEINHTFADWPDFFAAAARLARISILRPVTPQEQQVMSAWRTAALADEQRFSQIMYERTNLAMWGNCGQTTMLVQGRLRANYAARTDTVRTVTYKGGIVAGLEAQLKQLPPDAGKIDIVDCDLGGVHNFLIEARHDGTRYLIQGYQGLYPAPWWTADTVRNPVSGQPVEEELHGFRARYGLGQDISPLYDDFVAAIVALAQQGYQGYVRQQPAWRSLPFHTTDKNATVLVTKPDVKVGTFRVRNADAVRIAMGNVQGSLCAQATLSLPVPEAPVDQAGVADALRRLGLTAAYSKDPSGTHLFKVTAVDNGPQELKARAILLVDGLEVPWLRSTDLPAAGAVNVVYSFRGTETVAACTIR